MATLGSKVPARGVGAVEPRGGSGAAPARILVVTGPTGIGKSRVADALARLTPVEVVSADAGQVYRYLNIGTAKPSPAERERLPYHGLDLILPTERFSAGRFARDARRWIEDIAARGRLPVVVGGTGFYLRALFEGLFVEPSLDPARRARLRAALEVLDPSDLCRWAARLDPGYKGGGAQRAARAIEVALLTGRPLSQHQRTAPPAPSGLAPWYAVLRLPREKLTLRIGARTEAMLEAGLVDEVKRVINAGVPLDAPGLAMIGYAEVVAMLSGEMDEMELAPAIALATRRYAKRQETWLRHQLRGPVTWFDAALSPETLAKDVLAGYRAATA